jgi:hypothetical protein
MCEEPVGVEVICWFYYVKGLRFEAGTVAFCVSQIILLENKDELKTDLSWSKSYKYTGVPGGMCQTSGGCSLC